MLNLPNIPTGATGVLPQNDSAASLSPQNGAEGDRFDQIMREALGHSGAHQKSGGANPSQTGNNGVSLRSNFFNETKQSVLRSSAEPAVAPTKGIIFPAQAVNARKSLTETATDQPKRNALGGAGAPAPRTANSSTSPKPVSIPTPVGSEGQGDEPSNPKGQNSAKSEAVAPPTSPDTNVIPPSTVHVQSLPPEISSVIFSGIILNSAPPSASAPQGVANAAVPPDGPTVATPLEKHTGGDSSSIAGGSSAITVLTDAAPKGSNGQKSATTGTSYAPISAAASGVATPPNDAAPVVLNQLIPASGQNPAVATNPAAPLATATKSAEPAMNQLPSSGPTESAGPEASIGGNAPSINDGTSSALLMASMNNSGKSDKSAELGGQLLPSSISGIAQATDSSSLISQASVGMATDALGSKAASTPGIWISTHGTASNSAVDLERMHDLVATHAMRLENSGNASLTVVIKPGGGMQMSLELRQQSDGIQAHASLQQGDYKHLSQNWPELQQRLEQRGIRLAPLRNDGSSSFTSSGGGHGGGPFGQSHPQSSEPLLPLGFGGTRTTTATASGPSAPAKTVAGWETWA